MRTDEQRQAFAKECWEIEKQGGDVLEYIRVNWPSYTPGATWFNLQRVYLLDKKMTSGKPQKEGGEEEMRRDRIETLNGILEALRKGEHPFDYLEKAGYMNVMQAYHDTRAWARKNDPDKFQQLPASLRGLGVKRKSVPINFKQDPVPDLKPGEALPLRLKKNAGENPSEEQKQPETVVFGGKEYEKYEKPETVVEMKDKHGNTKRVKLYGASPTCCQPAKPSGVTVPDEVPEEKPVVPMKLPEVKFKEHKMMVADEIHAWKTPLPVCAVKSRIKGEWHLSQVEGCVHLIWEDKITHEERSLGLPAADWMKLAGEIPQMLMQLGLSN